MPLEDGHEDPMVQPSKKMKLENGFNEEPVVSTNAIDDSFDDLCPVCSGRLSSRLKGKEIPKAGFQIRFK